MLNILDTLKTQIQSGQISKSDLQNLLNSDFPDTPNAVSKPQTDSQISNQDSHSIKISQILYTIGGIVVYLGIAALLSQNWTTFDFITKILFTLGLSFVCLIAAVILMHQDKDSDLIYSLSLVHFIVSELALPVGIYVALDNFGYSLSNIGTLTIFSLILFVYNYILYLGLKRDVVLLATIFWGTFFYFAFPAFVLQNIATSWIVNVYNFSFGIGYLIFTFWLSKKYFMLDTVRDIFRSILSVLMDLLGLFMVYFSIFMLAGTNDYPANLGEGIAEIAILPTIIIGFYYSFRYKNYTVMVVTGIALFAYIIKIIQRYLYDKLLPGPIAFIFAGLLVIGSGFLVLAGRKYYNNRFSQISS